MLQQTRFVKGKISVIFLQTLKCKTTQNLNSFVDRHSISVWRGFTLLQLHVSINIADFLQFDLKIHMK